MWGWEAAWIRVSMLALVVMIVIGAAVTRRAMERLRASVDTAAAHDMLVWSYLTRAGILAGIVFLMTVKPPLQESPIAVATAVGAGSLAGRPARTRRARRVV